MSAPVSLDIENGVATITIRRPDRSNALRPQDFDLLHDALLSASRGDEVRALVLTGQGERAFCAGADLSGGPSFHKANGHTGLGDVLRAAWRVDKPIIARVNGACRGGGMALLGLCDAAVAADNASFAFPEIRLGFFPHVVLCGWRGHRAEAVVTAMAGDGAAMDAQAAQAAGLVNEIATADQLDACLRAAITRLLAAGRERRRRSGEDLERAVSEAERRLAQRAGAA